MIHPPPDAIDWFPGERLVRLTERAVEAVWWGGFYAGAATATAAIAGAFILAALVRWVRTPRSNP